MITIESGTRVINTLFHRTGMVLCIIERVNAPLVYIIAISPTMRRSNYTTIPRFVACYRNEIIPLTYELVRKLVQNNTFNGK